MKRQDERASRGGPSPGPFGSSAVWRRPASEGPGPRTTCLLPSQSDARLGEESCGGFLVTGGARGGVVPAQAP